MKTPSNGLNIYFARIYTPVAMLFVISNNQSPPRNKKSFLESAHTQRHLWSSLDQHVTTRPAQSSSSIIFPQVSPVQKAFVVYPIAKCHYRSPMTNVGQKNVCSTSNLKGCAISTNASWNHATSHDHAPMPTRFWMHHGKEMDPWLVFSFSFSPKKSHTK